MSTDTNMAIWLFTWIIILLIVVLKNTGKDVSRVGLSAMFALIFTKDYWFGAFIYSLPWYHGDNEYFTILGFIKATQAFFSFAVGSLILAPFLSRIFRFSWFKSKKYLPDLQLPVIYIVLGYFFYFTLQPVLGGLPSIRTFVYSGWNLMVAGLCLVIWKNWCLCNKKMVTLWLFFALLVPLFTTINIGFLGVGVDALIIVVIFTARFYRPRWKIVLGLSAIVFLGVSFYVNYMEARGEIRARPAEERAAVVTEMFHNFDFFSLSNQKHLESIDVRLNMSSLVGASIDHLQSGNQEFAKGSTIKEAFLAMIPRMLWPQKTMRLGGSEMATKYTGIIFQGASVAIGLVMEFYINFGTVSVVIGFLILGVIITLIDQAAAVRLEAGDWKGFVFWFLPSLSLMATESLTQAIMTAAAAVVFSILINKFIIPVFALQKKDHDEF